MYQYSYNFSVIFLKCSTCHKDTRYERFFVIPSLSFKIQIRQRSCQLVKLVVVVYIKVRVGMLWPYICHQCSNRFPVYWWYIRLVINICSWDTNSGLIGYEPSDYLYKSNRDILWTFQVVARGPSRHQESSDYLSETEWGERSSLSLENFPTYSYKLNKLFYKVRETMLELPTRWKGIRKTMFALMNLLLSAISLRRTRWSRIGQITCCKKIQESSWGPSTSN